jgi:DHA1 family multidrug resistance protein-like MFS transporter
VPIIGTGFFAPGFYLTFQSILNYLGESYPRHAASVFAGNIFFRSSFGGALPLAAPRMLKSLGIGWAASTLGLISLALVPLPFILERVSGSTATSKLCATDQWPSILTPC